MNDKDIGIGTCVSGYEMVLYAIASRRRHSACRAMECHFEMGRNMMRHATVSDLISACGPFALDEVYCPPTHSMGIAEMLAYLLRIPFDPFTTRISPFIPLALIQNHMNLGILFSILLWSLYDLNNAVIMT